MYVETARSSYAGTKRLGHDEPADAKPRRDRLRERRGEGHALATFELVERPGRGAFVANEPVGVVLEHVELVLPTSSATPPATLLAERSAARVLERRNGVEERDVASRARAPPRARPGRALRRPSRRETTSTLLPRRGASAGDRRSGPRRARAPVAARAARRRRRRSPAAHPSVRKTRPGSTP